MTSKKEEKKININGKPKYINLGTDYNFFELFQKIQLNFVNCFLFESLGEESNISRYHIIGFDPKYIISSENDYELKMKDHPFKHGVGYALPNGITLYGAYHPSPRNVNTKRITFDMMVAFLKQLKNEI